jgi:hypothetical protein
LGKDGDRIHAATAETGWTAHPLFCSRDHLEPRSGSFALDVDLPRFRGNGRISRRLIRRDCQQGFAVRTQQCGVGRRLIDENRDGGLGGTTCREIRWLGDAAARAGIKISTSITR